MSISLQFLRHRSGVRRRDAHHLLEALLESVELAVVACAPDGRLTHASRRTCELLGVDCAGLSSDAWLSRCRPRTASGVPLAVEDVPLMRALEGEAVRDVDVLIRTASGDMLVSACATPVADRRGKRRGAVVVLEDVTELRAQEARSREAWRA